MINAMVHMQICMVANTYHLVFGLFPACEELELL